MAGEIIITCVNAGNYLGQGALYVNTLFDMVERNISSRQAFKFICFTDDATGLHENITVRSLPEGVKGWYNKLYLFKDGVFKDGERIIFFDLDTAICSGLDDLIKYAGDLAMIRDFYHPRNANGVMMWKAGMWGAFWNEYVKAGYPDHYTFGDMDWMNILLTKWKYKPDVIQDLLPKQVVSFKAHASHSIPKGARVVCFHGLPRPHEVQSGWVPHIWKIGGGSSQEWEVQCNTADEVIIGNIKNSITLGLPALEMLDAHGGEALIVGGGPSLKGDLASLRAHQVSGGKIFATNNTYNYLLGNKIRADYHVMLDARIENKDFLSAHAHCFFASQCHPEVFRLAKKYHNKVTLWHTAENIVQGVIGDNTGDPLIGGGSSVGLKAISLAHVLGYRVFHLYGFDSSYEEGKNHAYSQKLNDKERVMDVNVNGRQFRISPWMATQVEQFKEIAPIIVNEGCTIAVHGNGLLPYIAHLMSTPESMSRETAA